MIIPKPVKSLGDVISHRPINLLSQTSLETFSSHNNIFLHQSGFWIHSTLSIFECQWGLWQKRGRRNLKFCNEFEVTKKRNGESILFAFYFGILSYVVTMLEKWHILFKRGGGKCIPRKNIETWNLCTNI